MKSWVRSLPLCKPPGTPVECCRTSWVPGECKWERRLGSKTEGRPRRGCREYEGFGEVTPVSHARGPGWAPAGPPMRQAVPPQINTLQEQICALGSLKWRTEQNGKHRSREGEDKGQGRQEASERSAEVHERRFLSSHCGALTPRAAVRGYPRLRGLCNRNLRPHGVETGSPRSQLVNAAGTRKCVCVSSPLTKAAVTLD